jgi:hypothetical protein
MRTRRPPNLPFTRSDDFDLIGTHLCIEVFKRSGSARQVTGLDKYQDYDRRSTRLLTPWLSN